LIAKPGMMLSVREFIERYLPGMLRHRSLVLIEGYPGAGKSTFAASICYDYALRGEKCLYITFHEDKEKFFTILSTLGIQFANMEREGLFKYIKLPVSSDIEAFLDTVNKYLYEFKPKVIVIDTINPLLKAVETDFARRAYLHNYFAALPETINGLVILVYESPLREAEIYSEMEYVPDTIIALKYEVSRGLLTRIAEVKKSRGSPLKMIRFPFTIQEGRGMRIIVPMILEEIPPVRSETLKLPFPIAGVDHLFKGEIVLIDYPPDARIFAGTALILALAAVNNLRVLFVSYRLSPEDLRRVFVNELASMGLSEHLANEIVDKYVVFKSISPFAQSIPEMLAQEISLVESVKPDIVVFHDVDVFWYISDLRDYYADLYNELQFLKSRGVTTLRISRHVSEEFYALNSSLSDIVIRFYLTADGRLAAYFWLRGKPPVIVKPEELEKYINALKSYLETISKA